MPQARNLSDQELVDLAHHWRRLALGGDQNASSEASQHEAEVRRRFGEVDQFASSTGPKKMQESTWSTSSSLSADEIANRFVIATADASTQSDGALRDLLRNLRILLEMDIAFVAEFVDGQKVFRGIDQDAASTVCVKAGDSAPLEQTLCQRVVDGRAPQMHIDARSEPSLEHVPGVKRMNISAYLSTPVVLRDGRVYGTLCCLSHTPRTALGNKQIDALRYVAGVVAAELDKREGRYQSIDNTSCLI